MHALPSEILFEIVSYLTSQHDIYALALVNRRFNNLFTRPLYLFNHAYNGCDGLSWAATHGRLATASIFLDFGIPVDTKFIPSASFRPPDPLTGQRQPIHWIAVTLSPSSVSTGFAPLHLATLSNHEALVDLFLQRGANAKLPLPTQTSALAIALDHRNERIACLLAAHLPDFSTYVLDHFRKLTPLHRAAWLRLPLCTRFFLGKGADVNALDSQGNTPLHHALAVEYDQLGLRDARRCDHVANHHRETVLALVRAGADLEKEGYYGYTPRVMAFAWGDEAVVECLLGKGEGTAGEAWRWANSVQAKALVGAGAGTGGGVERGGRAAVAEQGDWQKCVELLRVEARRWTVKGTGRGPFISDESGWGRLLTVQEWVGSVMQRVAEGVEVETKAARQGDERPGSGLTPFGKGTRRSWVEELQSRWAGIWRAWTQDWKTTD